MAIRQAPGREPVGSWCASSSIESASRRGRRHSWACCWRAGPCPPLVALSLRPCRARRTSTSSLPVLALHAAARRCSRPSLSASRPRCVRARVDPNRGPEGRRAGRVRDGRAQPRARPHRRRPGRAHDDAAHRAPAAPLKSFREVMRVEAGFDPGVLTVRLSLPRKDYRELAKVSQFYRAARGPRGRAAGRDVGGRRQPRAAQRRPRPARDYKVADRPPASTTSLPTAQYRMATPGYFQTMGIPMIAGRAPSATTTARAAAPVVDRQPRAWPARAFADRDPRRPAPARAGRAGTLPAHADRRRGRRRATHEPGGGAPSLTCTCRTTRPTATSSSGSPTTSSSSCARRVRPSPWPKRVRRELQAVDSNGGVGGHPRERVLRGQRDGGPALQPRCCWPASPAWPWPWPRSGSTVSSPTPCAQRTRRSA